MQKKYIFKPYSEKFPVLFSKEAEGLRKLLPKQTMVEHVGSTAIQGLGGKGIIDIAIAASQEKWPQLSPILIEFGYEFQPRFSTEERLFFKAQRADPEEGHRTYHIHLMDGASKQWLDMVFFRDYLRKYPEAMKEYAKIKEKAALEAHGQGEVYRKSKQPFLQEILRKRK